ncbi:MAG: Fis family transcriptional regulator [Nitrospinae bacterium]|nr:Fis family transcriptional regulator [Nitrospinota bacterium]
MNIEEWLNKRLRQYVSKIDGSEKGDLHNLIIRCIEESLIKIVLNETNGNQIKAANILGISRNTLRKKVKEMEIIYKKQNGNLGYRLY